MGHTGRASQSEPTIVVRVAGPVHGADADQNNGDNRDLGTDRRAAQHQEAGLTAHHGGETRFDQGLQWHHGCGKRHRISGVNQVGPRKWRSKDHWPEFLGVQDAMMGSIDDTSIFTRSTVYTVTRLNSSRGVCRSTRSRDRSDKEDFNYELIMDDAEQFRPCATPSNRLYSTL